MDADYKVKVAYRGVNGSVLVQEVPIPNDYSGVPDFIKEICRFGIWMNSEHTDKVAPGAILRVWQV